MFGIFGNSESVDDLGNSEQRLFSWAWKESNTKDLKGRKFHHIPQILFAKGIKLN